MGAAISAFFGAPTAHEDDPLRAVLVINDIQPFRHQRPYL